MKTPIQEVIIKIQKFIKDEVDYGGDWDTPFQIAEHNLIEKLEYEEKIFKQIFVAGIMLGKQDRDFDLDGEFKKYINKKFTS
jgi:hypothetical protein